MLTSISFVVDYKIQVNLFIPVINELLNRGCRINIYTSEPIELLIRSEAHRSNGLIFFDLDDLKHRYRLLIYVHKLLKEVFTQSDFSFQHSLRPTTSVSDGLIKSIVSLSLRAVAKLTPSVRNSKINSFLSEVMSVISPRLVFRDAVVVVGSLNGSAALLSGRDQVIVTFMESWDHAIKTPNGYRSKLVFAWNTELKSDWEERQGDRNVKQYFASKLMMSRGACEFSEQDKTAIVYCVASTQRFSLSSLYRIERKIIYDLACLTFERGEELILKLRPNGSYSDFDDIQSEFAHVRVTTVTDESIDIAPNYYLSREYNQRRFRELKSARCVVNAFTTFGLDAALAGMPVLQLDLSNLHGFLDSREFYRRNHIKKYLISGEYVCRPTQDFRQEISSCLDDSKFCNAYSRQIVKWLDLPAEETVVVKNAVDELARLCK